MTARNYISRQSTIQVALECVQLVLLPGPARRPSQGAHSGLGPPFGRTDRFRCSRTVIINLRRTSAFLQVESLLTQPPGGYQAGSAHTQKGAMLMAFWKEMIFFDVTCFFQRLQRELWAGAENKNADLNY